MPKVKSTPIVAADSKSFFASGAPEGQPEPPMLGQAEATDAAIPNAPNPAFGVAGPTPDVPPVPSGRPVAAVKPPLPDVAPDPFVLIWERKTTAPENPSVVISSRSLRAMELDGTVVLKYSWTSMGGFIAESMCTLPGFRVKKTALGAELVADNPVGK